MPVGPATAAPGNLHSVVPDYRHPLFPAQLASGNIGSGFTTLQFRDKACDTSPVTRRFALIGLTLSTLLVVAAYALAFLPGGGGNATALLMIFGIATMTVSIMLLGAAKKERKLGVLVPAFVAVFAIIAGGFTLALLSPADDPSSLLLGLPRRAAIVIYGIGFLPVFILPLAYAATFEERTLSEEDLRKVREKAAEHRAEAAAGE